MKASTPEHFPLLAWTALALDGMEATLDTQMDLSQRLELLPPHSCLGNQDPQRAWPLWFLLAQLSTPSEP